MFTTEGLESLDINILTNNYQCPSANSDWALIIYNVK